MIGEQLLNTVRHELLRRNPASPALLKYEEKRAENVQSRIADGITAFAGSMAFVYVHIVWFALWVSIPLEKYPFGLLTMIVSLEAIFLDLRDDQPEPRRRAPPARAEEQNRAHRRSGRRSGAGSGAKQSDRVFVAHAPR